MVGVSSYGAYIPMLRLSLAAIAGGKPGAPEKAVANWDEDGLSMAVAAAIACLEGVDRTTVDGVLFASTSYAFKEKQGAAIVAKALDLRRDVVTADLGDSLRAGTTALRAAVDSIKAGSAKRVLVVAGDTRLAAPRSPLEANLGDGAAAFLLGDTDVAASLEAAHAVADEIIDVWRREGDPFVHSWEDRFVVDHGYRQNVRDVVRGLLEKTGLATRDFAKLALYGPDARSHAMVARGAGGLRQVPPLPPAARHGARPAGGGGHLGDHPLPRPRPGREPARPPLPALRDDAVSLPARLLSLLCEGRLRQGAPLRPARHAQVVHLRLLRRQPRPAAHRHRDRR